MGSFYPKMGKLYLSYKDSTGKWRGRSSGLPLGEEKRAARMLEAIERRIAVDMKVGRGGKVTVSSYSRQWTADRRAQGIASVRDDEARLRLHILPRIGDMAIADVRPRHMRELVRCTRKKVSTRGELLAPRTVHHIYATTRRMFLDAIIDEVIETSPCVLGRHDLPKKIDKDPTFRSKATFISEELELVINDDRVPDDRQMLYALEGIGATRFGEAIARRWRDYDSRRKPLGSLLIAISFDVKTHKEKSTKTQAPREMPVHPALAKMLAAWKLGGWERMMGRPPKPDDLIVPSRKGGFRNVNHGLRQFHGDLDRLGLRRRRQHDLRRTFITLARAGGARPDILRWVTHGPTGDIIDIYSSLPWGTLCDAVLSLKIEIVEPRVISLKAL